LTEVQTKIDGTVVKHAEAVMEGVYLFLCLKGNATHNLLHIHKSLLNCQVMENTAAVENVGDDGDVKVNLLPHLTPILLQQSTRVLNYTSTVAMSFVEVCLC
jgi:hypothetical protein